MGHDQLFKAILEKFFKDFLELFFSSVAKRLNFGSLVFLDKELFADLPQGPTREARRARWCPGFAGDPAPVDDQQLPNLSAADGKDAIHGRLELHLPVLRQVP